MDTWLRVVVAVLATWRVAHLVAREDGPGDIVARMKRRVTHQGLGRMLDCIYCSSLWFAAPIALWVTTTPLDWLLTTVAISGAVLVIERAGDEPVVIREIAQGVAMEEGERDELLRPQPDDNT